MALTGESPATVHLKEERQPLDVRLVLPRSKRSSIADLSQIPIKGASGDIVPLAELGSFIQKPSDQTIYHKNLKRVAFVYGEMAGRSPVNAVLSMQKKLKAEPLSDELRAEWGRRRRMEDNSKRIQGSWPCLWRSNDRHIHFTWSSRPDPT